jgi:hypothetical protein
VKIILLVAAAAVAVVAVCFLATGDVLSGTIAATRFTARFSALVFALALMARAGRPQFLAARWQSLTYAFVAAHVVHYGTVATRAFVEPGNRLRQLALEPALVVAGGVSLIVVLAATRGRIQSVVFYVAGIILALALSSRVAHAAQYPTSTIAFAILIAAFAWRIGCALKR